MNVRALVITTVFAIAAVSVIAVVVSLQPRAQAHDDGTIHIHPTPTPTPPPPLGLNGPLKLDTTVMYDDATRKIFISSVISNPPPEGWVFDTASTSIEASHNRWKLNSSAHGYHWDLRGVFFDGERVAFEMELPDYAEFNRLTEPVLARVQTGLTYCDHRANQCINLSEQMYIDLNDRNNWR